MAVANDEIFACVVIPPPKVNVEELLWDETVATGAAKAVVVGVPKVVVAFGSDPNDGVGLLNDEFALPNVGG